jgi:hypothetical protein
VGRVERWGMIEGGGCYPRRGAERSIAYSFARSVPSQSESRSDNRANYKHSFNLASSLPRPGLYTLRGIIIPGESQLISIRGKLTRWSRRQLHGENPTSNLNHLDIRESFAKDSGMSPCFFCFLRSTFLPTRRDGPLETGKRTVCAYAK